MSQRSAPDQNGVAAMSLRLGTVFSPAAPVNQASLFAGRQRQLLELSDAVNQRGMHAVLFGERGVGKTSLANVFPELLATAGITGLGVSRVNCDSSDTFLSLWEKTTREIQVSHQLRMAGFTERSRKTTTTLDNLLPEEPTPEDIRYYFQRLGRRLLLVIDEFDRVTDENVSRLMADTIKALSDHSVNVTLVLVGVADNVDELLREHQSIDRCLVQVHMPRMSLGELTDILSKALSTVGMEMEDPASAFITYLSHGLPHYTHLLGLASGRAALENERTKIQMEDALAAIGSAVHQAQRSIMVSYDSATSSPRRESLFEQVLLACALAPVDELGYFTASEVKGPMSMIMDRPYDTPAFARHLDRFCDPERGAVLQKTGSRYRYRFRFIDPVMQPYVLIRGLHQELVTLEMMESLRSDSPEEG